VLQPQLSVAALGQLLSQLVKLQLADPRCSANELVAHAEALQQLRTLILLYSEQTGMEHVVGHAAAWASISSLHGLDLHIEPDSQRGAANTLEPAVAAGVSGATSLTKLYASFESGCEPGVDLVAMLYPLRQLESLELRFGRTLDPIITLRGLLSEQLTSLKSLTLELGPLRLLVLAQICLQATQLTQLVLVNTEITADRMMMMARGMTQLRRLALCSGADEGLVLGTGDVLQALLPPCLPSLEQLALVDPRWDRQWRRHYDPIEVIEQVASQRRPPLTLASADSHLQLPCGFVGTLTYYRDW
jgi:hypothetical protein